MKTEKSVIVPVAWLERLIELRDKVHKKHNLSTPDDELMLIGYLDSIEAILKYNKYEK